MKFKVGDNVRVCTPSNRHRVSALGRTGIIVGDDKGAGDYRWYIRVDKDHVYRKHDHGDFGMVDNFYYRSEELEHARIKDTKIARKLNKNNISKVENGWLYLGGKND